MKSVRNVLWCILVLAATTIVQAQFGEKERDLPMLKTQTSPVVSTPLTTAPALDGPIDPGLFFVGPSDMFLIGIWTSPPATFTLAVTPEGTLVIPTVGEIRVADLTLTEARTKVLSEIRKKYLSGEPTVTLVTPRKVLISVTGSVQYPGRYVLNATDRVDRAISAANEYQRDRAIPFIDREEPRVSQAQKQSTRNIQLRRRIGAEVRVDLDKFNVTGEGRWNPYLRDGDEVFVPRMERTKDIIAIYGGVQREGRFELAPNDSVSDLLQLAHGFTSRATRDSVLLSRYDSTSVHLSVRAINAEAILKARRPNIALMSGDRIVVPERPELREDFRVSIEGEVRYPGTYPITRDRTKLSELFRMCGGLTEFALLKSAELIRTTGSGDDLQFERMLAMRGSVSPDDSSYYVLESELRLRHEVVNVDIERLVLAHDTTQDVVVSPNDRLVVPSVHKSVYVFGQVVSPGNVPFVPGRRVSYYVEKAGGLTDNARSGDMMIIKRANRQWLAPGETSIEEGDYVWVPKEPQRSFAYYMNIIGQTASVIGVAVSLGLLVHQFTK